MELEGRVALVTGAARRVGRAIAERLAGEGCRLALHHHRSDIQPAADACRAAGAEVATYRVDLTDVPAAQRMVADVLQQFGQLDIVVNNASIFERMTVDDFDPVAWDRTLRTNLMAPMALVAAARNALRAARGRVVNLCDVSTARPWPDHLAYMASKGALDVLTQALARGLAPEVNVVGVAPGVAAWPDAYDEETKARLLQRVPLRRAGTVGDIAAAVHFLLRDGDYITGTIVPVDGGRHVV